MTSRERCRIAMAGGTPDHVPFIPQICHPHAIRVLGKDFRSTMIAALENPTLINQLQLDCARLYGVDGVRQWILPDPARIEDDGDTAWALDPKTGERTGRVDFAGGGWVEPLSDAPAIRDDADLDAIPVPRADDLLQSPKFADLRASVEDAASDLFVIGSPGSFTVEYGMAMRGKERVLEDLMERPEFLQRMIDKATTIAIEKSIAMARLGMHAFYIGETYGGLIGPRHFREFCVPAFTRYVQALHPYGLPIYLHICGRSGELFELMADTGVNCIEPLDPLGDVVVADAKRRVGKRVALMGGVDTRLLAHGTLDEVVADTRRCLREGAPGGGYLLACGDMLPTETSAEKVRAMVELTRTEGVYPL